MTISKEDRSKYMSINSVNLKKEKYKEGYIFMAHQKKKSHEKRKKILKAAKKKLFLVANFPSKNNASQKTIV